ncbi:hypothetical protein HK101_008385 [Irineochytrium annulatum]|nr:hypothetical protein HK101_008385 [Irineochytrium annulatum]
MKQEGRDHAADGQHGADTPRTGVGGGHLMDSAVEVNDVSAALDPKAEPVLTFKLRSWQFTTLNNDHVEPLAAEPEDFDEGDVDERDVSSNHEHEPLPAIVEDMPQPSYPYGYQYMNAEGVAYFQQHQHPYPTTYFAGSVPGNPNFYVDQEAAAAAAQYYYNLTGYEHQAVPTPVVIEARGDGSDASTESISPVEAVQQELDPYAPYAYGYYQDATLRHPTENVSTYEVAHDEGYVGSPLLAQQQQPVPADLQPGVQEPLQPLKKRKYTKRNKPEAVMMKESSVDIHSADGMGDHSGDGMGLTQISGRTGSRKRIQCKVACTNCKKACKKCDDYRPCSRCVRLNLPDCVSSSRKPRPIGIKRGKYKKAPKPGDVAFKPDLADYNRWKSSAEVRIALPPMQAMPPMQGMPQMQAMPQMQGMHQMQAMPPMQGMPPMHAMPQIQAMPPMQVMHPGQVMPPMQAVQARDC